MVDILGTLDEKIEKNNLFEKQIENLFSILWSNCFNLKNYENDYIGNIISIKYGKNLPTNLLQDTGYVVFGGNGPIGYYSKYMYDTSKVLVSCRGAASGNVIFSYPYSFITNNSLILEDNDNIMFPYLRGLSKELHFEKYTTGSAQPQITIENITNIIIPIPPKNDQLQFSHYATALLDRLEHIRLENQKLNELKQLYLKKFFG